MAKYFTTNRKLVLSSTILTTGMVAILAAVMFHLSSGEIRNNDSQFLPEKTASSDDKLPIDIHFNIGENYPNLPVTQIQNPKNTIKELLNTAQEDIYIAIYSINFPELKDWVAKAHNRGVKIHIIYDEVKKDDIDITFQEDLNKYEVILAHSFPDIDHPEQRSIMHHKFILVDPDSQSNATVLTGTLNLTEFQILYDPSNSLVIKDYDIAQSYKQEFERIKNGLHGPNKSKSIHYKPFSLYKTFSDGSLELWFSPKTDKSAFSDRIKELIRQSKKSIYFVDWYFTDETIANEIYKKQLEGLDIRGIVDDNNMWLKGSVAPNMLGLYQNNPKAKLWEKPLMSLTSDFFRSSYLTHSFIPKEEKYQKYFSFLHQHNMIIDGEIVVTGAGNWSDSADRSNDEDGMVIKNTPITNIFLNNFWHHYQSLGGQGNINDWSMETNSSNNYIKIEKLSPNTKDNELTLISTTIPYETTFEASIVAKKQLTLKASETKIILNKEDIQDLLKDDQKAKDIFLIDSEQRLLVHSYYLP